MLAMVQASAFAPPQSPIHCRPRAALKKTNSKKIDFAYSFRPIYYISRFYGLMPFTITYNSRGTIHGPKVKMFDILWFIVSIIINLIYAFKISKDTLYLQDPKKISNILIGGDYFLEVFSIIFIILLIGMNMCIRSKLVDIVKKINTFDEEVSQFIVLVILCVLFFSEIQ